MRTVFLVFYASFLLIGFTANGQTVLDKVNNGVIKANSAKGSLDKIKGWLPKKKVKTDTAVTVTQPLTIIKDTTKLGSNKSTTVVSISSIDFAKLKALNENIRACSNVISTSMKYNSAASTIEVIHNGSTEDLLKLMSETSKDIFTDKNLAGFEDGRIALKL